MCTFWTLCSHVCEPTLSLKVLENEFCESWKTLEFGLYKSWKVLENSLLLSVRTLNIGVCVDVTDTGVHADVTPCACPPALRTCTEDNDETE